jgi:hypothetical protein
MGREMIDWNKPIETVEDKLKAKIIARLSDVEDAPTMIWVESDRNGWGNIFLIDNQGYRCDDRAIYSKRQEPFIRNVRVKREGWVNIYGVYKTEEEAKRACVDLDRGCHRFVRWEE